MPDLFKAAIAKIPWGRMATAEEVANAAVFLVSPQASFITGVNLAMAVSSTAMTRERRVEREEEPASIIQ